jgi:hypothetical protein
MKINLPIVALKMLLSLSIFAAGLSLVSAASFARNDGTYASPNGKTYSRALPRILRQTYGFAAHQTPQYLRFRDIYQSDSLGRQSFPNPDRDFDGPNTNNSF